MSLTSRLSAHIQQFLTHTPLHSKNILLDKNSFEKDTTDSDENIKCSRKIKEFDRKCKREKARDLNRPNLNSNLDDTVCNSDNDWVDGTEEENSTELDSITSKQLDKSLEYIKARDKFKKRQHKMRRRSFNSNRRSSTSKNSHRSTDDWDKNKSSASLLSESTLNLSTPKKSCTRNFLDTHIAEVNRMSDYYVPKKCLNLSHDESSRYLSISFKETQVPIRVIIVMLTIGAFAFIALFSHLNVENDNAKYQSST